MASLGLRLGRSVPFTRVAALSPVDGEVHAAPSRATARVTALSESLADDATVLVEAFADPPEGEGDIDAVLPLYESAFDSGLPGVALDVLASLVTGGVPASAADRVRALAAPLLGD